MLVSAHANQLSVNILALVPKLRKTLMVVTLLSLFLKVQRIVAKHTMLFKHSRMQRRESTVRHFVCSQWKYMMHVIWMAPY